MTLGQKEIINDFLSGKMTPDTNQEDFFEVLDLVLKHTPQASVPSDSLQEVFNSHVRFNFNRLYEMSFNKKIQDL